MRQVARDYCASCSIGCEHIYKAPGGKTARVEYENVFALGPLCGVSDPDSVLAASARASRTISGGFLARDAKRAGPRLTDRESEVLRLIARGYSNPQISTELMITRRTVESHVTTILNKLGLSSRTQLALWAVEHGMSSSAGGR